MCSRFISNSFKLVFSPENVLVLYPFISWDSCAFKYNTSSFLCLGISVFLGQVKGVQIVFVLEIYKCASHQVNYKHIGLGIGLRK